MQGRTAMRPDGKGSHRGLPLQFPAMRSRAGCATDYLLGLWWHRPLACAGAKRRARSLLPKTRESLVIEKLRVETNVEFNVVSLTQRQRDRGYVGALIQPHEKIRLRGGEGLVPIQRNAPAADDRLPVFARAVVDFFVVAKEQFLIDPQNLPPVGVVGIFGGEFQEPHWSLGHVEIGRPPRCSRPLLSTLVVKLALPRPRHDCGILVGREDKPLG